MIASFRLRMFVVLVLLSLLLALQQSGQNEVIKAIDPYMKWTVTKDYGVREKLAAWWDNYSASWHKTALPAGTPELTRPVAEGRIARHYGWYFNPDTGQQQFNAGVILVLPENSVVHPVASGTVEEIINKKEGRTVKIDHGGGLVSSYGRLSEVFVELGEKVEPDMPLGKTKDTFSFQLFGREGALNPEFLFEK